MFMCNIIKQAVFLKRRIRRNAWRPEGNAALSTCVKTSGLVKSEFADFFVLSHLLVCMFLYTPCSPKLNATFFSHVFINWPYTRSPRGENVFFQSKPRFVLKSAMQTRVHFFGNINQHNMSCCYHVMIYDIIVLYQKKWHRFWKFFRCYHAMTMVWLKIWPLI